MEQICCHSTGFHEISYLSVFFKNRLRKFEFRSSLTRIIMGAVYEDICTFVTVLNSVLLTVGNVVDKS
jgi:hypothetical protein